MSETLSLVQVVGKMQTALALAEHLIDHKITLALLNMTRDRDYGGINRLEYVRDKVREARKLADGGLIIWAKPWTTLGECPTWATPWPPSEEAAVNNHLVLE